MKQGFGPGFGTVFRGIAQLVEQRSPKPRAEGSSPSAPAKNRHCVIIRKGGFFISFCSALCAADGQKNGVLA